MVERPIAHSGSEADEAMEAEAGGLGAGSGGLAASDSGGEASPGSVGLATQVEAAGWRRTASVMRPQA